METIFYGNGPIMANILTSIVYVLNSADYHTLLVLMMNLAGALMLGRWHMVNSEGGSGHHGLLVAIGTVVVLYYGGWKPQETLVIYDPLNSFQTAVTNVPLAFAEVVHISNKITNGFADLFDQGFQSSGFPDSMSYNNGMTSGLMAIESLGQLQPSDQFLTMNISNYFKDCVFPAMLMNNGSGPSVNDIAQSTNLLETIKTNLSNAWVTNYYSQSNPGGTSVTCSQMYTNLNNDITNAINSPTGSISKAYTNQMILGMSGAGAYANSNSNIDLLQSTLNYIISGSVSSQQMLAQAVLINSFNPALQSFAAQNGLNPNALNNALTQNILETTTTMTTSYAIAQQMLPMSFAIVCVLVYAILPIVFAMMFIPQLTKKFALMAFDLLMWIAFWAPLAAVVNAIVQASAAQTYNTLGVSSIAPQNWGYLMGHTYTLMAIAGDIMFSVPVLAFALASGSSYAMTAVAGSVAGLSKAAAARAASSMADMGGAQREQAEAAQFKQLDMAAKANNMPTDIAAQKLVEANASNPAATLATYSALGFNKMMQGEIGNRSFQLGVGEVFTNAAGGSAGATNANTLGGKQGERTKGGIQGAWDAYANSGAAQSGMSFSQWAATQSEYSESGTVSKAQQMEQLAHQYFGNGNDALFKMMSFENAIESRTQLGNAMGVNEAYKEAKKNGFKGDLTQFQEFMTNVAKQSEYGSALGTQAAGGNFGGVIPMMKTTSQGQHIDSYANANAVLDAVKGLGLPKFLENSIISQWARQGAAAGYRSKQGAYATESWGSQVKSAEASLLGGLFGSASNYVQTKEAADVMNMYKAQLTTALSTDNSAVNKFTNNEIANYLKKFGKQGALIQAASVVDAESQLIQMSVNNALKSDIGKKQMAELALSLGAQAESGFVFLGNGVKMKLEGQGSLKQQIAASLNSEQGQNFAVNVMKLAMTRKAFEIASEKPDNAFVEQKNLFNKVLSAGSSGNWEDVKKELGDTNIHTEKQLQDRNFQAMTPQNVTSDMIKMMGGTTKATLQQFGDLAKNIINNNGDAPTPSPRPVPPPMPSHQPPNMPNNNFTALKIPTNIPVNNDEPKPKS